MPKLRRTQQNIYDSYCSKARIASLCASLASADDHIRKSKALVEAHRRSKALDELSKPDSLEANLRIAGHLVEALQAAGYICKLSPGGTVH